jgi:hypothetical protein
MIILDHDITDHISTQKLYLTSYLIGNVDLILLYFIVYT